MSYHYHIIECPYCGERQQRGCRLSNCTAATVSPEPFTASDGFKAERVQCTTNEVYYYVDFGDRELEARRARWTDSIGRDCPDACGYAAICPECGAVMHTHSLSGKLEFNASGWGVWSAPHAESCSFRLLAKASDATWIKVKDREVYDIIVSAARAQ